MTRPKTLSCGGKGPCCHIGYAHRHCEHCDVVIDTRAGHWPYNPPQVYPFWNTNVGAAGGAQINTTSTFGVFNSDNTATALPDELQRLRNLPVNEYAEHACEVS